MEMGGKSSTPLFSQWSVHTEVPLSLDHIEKRVVRLVKADAAKDLSTLLYSDQIRHLFYEDLSEFSQAVLQPCVRLAKTCSSYDSFITVIGFLVNTCFEKDFNSDTIQACVHILMSQVKAALRGGDLKPRDDMTTFLLKYAIDHSFEYLNHHDPYRQHKRYNPYPRIAEHDYSDLELLEILLDVDASLANFKLEMKLGGIGWVTPLAYALLAPKDHYCYEPPGFTFYRWPLVDSAEQSLALPVDRQVIITLLKYGADPNLYNNYFQGGIPWEYTTEHMHNPNFSATDYLTVLMEAGVDVNSVCLHPGCEEQHNRVEHFFRRFAGMITVELLQALIDHGAVFSSKFSPQCGSLLRVIFEALFNYSCIDERLSSECTLFIVQSMGALPFWKSKQNMYGRGVHYRGYGRLLGSIYCYYPAFISKLLRSYEEFLFKKLPGPLCRSHEPPVKHSGFDPACPNHMSGFIALKYAVLCVASITLDHSLLQDPLLKAIDPKSGYRASTRISDQQLDELSYTVTQAFTLQTQCIFLIRKRLCFVSGGQAIGPLVKVLPIAGSLKKLIGLEHLI